ncbi:hypothetical protein ACIQXD_35850 [Streptomyces uncialis]
MSWTTPRRTAAVQDAELLVPLNRHGRTGTVRVSVELARARFRDLPAGTV